MFGCKGKRPSNLNILLLLSIISIASFIATSCVSLGINRADTAWWNKPDTGRVGQSPSYKVMERTSEYLIMRDGIKIAIDLYLPEGLAEGEKIPAILTQSRYVRGLEYRWPFSLFLGGRYDNTIEYFVTYGYAWVYVEARGSGASFGTRPFPYSREEIMDGAEIADWIISQPWSNGKIGAWGNSYDGGSAIFLLTNNHPAVIAIMPRYAMFDVYSDLIFPGGIYFQWGIESWDSLCRALDANAVEEFAGLKALIAVRGIRPVDADHDLSMLRAAVAEHAHNEYASNLLFGITYRDDESPGLPGVTINDVSPHARLEEIKSSGAAIYLYTGWFDTSFVLSEINLFINLEDPYKKLTIGPWDHGGWNNISPFSLSDRPFFNSDAESLCFFDYHLKGMDTGIYNEHPVHYFTMGEQKWKSADTWPPPGTETVTYYLTEDNILVSSAPASPAGFDNYKVDYTAGTGSNSRWNSLVNPRHAPIYYPDRSEEDKKLLCYTTAPLDEDTEVTGHPIVTLYVSSSAEDGNFFAYLEDVNPDGKVTYVTEGMLRALHRNLSDETPPYIMITPYHTFKRKDGMPLQPGKVAELVFDLYPTSYLFKKGHSIRIALSGADKDHFALNPNEPPTVRFYRNSTYQSRIVLPVMRRHR